MKSKFLLFSIFLIGIIGPNTANLLAQTISIGELIGRPAEEFKSDEPDDFYFYYVDNQSLNLRREPSSSSKIIAKLQKYDCLYSAENITPGKEWLRVCYNDAENGEDLLGYVNVKYIKSFIGNDPIPSSKLKATWYIVSDKWSQGALTFEKKGDDYIGEIEIGYVSTENPDGPKFIQIVDERIDCQFNQGYLYYNEEPYSSAYDAKTGLLYFCGFLWKVD